MTPDLELRRKVAEGVGWTEITEVPYGWMGTHPLTLMCETVPAYDLSLDACMPDVVPKARETGYWLELGQDASCWEATWVDRHNGVGAEGIADNPATAVCLAFCELMKG